MKGTIIITIEKAVNVMANRDSYFDNARFILIFLVVFGHLIQSYVDANTFVATLYKFIYAFHMPAFILISGYFAKGIYQKPHRRLFRRRYHPDRERRVARDRQTRCPRGREIRDA